MRIKSIELAWFRGAATPVALEPNGKSMVVYGENGSGKSSFVDAVEYVVNNNGIEHLKNEYSGSHLINAIPNTHKSSSDKTTLKFKFRDDSQLNVEFRPNGSSKISGDEQVDMPNWQHRQTVLRQDDVSRFIHARKGEKYSALLPLLGLTEMEFAAENLRKLTQYVEAESHIVENKIKLKQMEQRQIDTFGSQANKDIRQAVDNLYREYYDSDPTAIDLISCCDELKTAINSRIQEYTATDRIQTLLRKVAETRLGDHVMAVRASGAQLASSMDSLIGQKLAVLKSADDFAKRLTETETVECPACGQNIEVDAFREHIAEESDRLKDINAIYITYRATIGTVCDTLTLLWSTLAACELQTWRLETTDQETLKGFAYLEAMDINSLRQSCTDDDLRAIESTISPIVAAAHLASRDAPPDMQKLTVDLEMVEVAYDVLGTGRVGKDVAAAEALLEWIATLQQRVRLSIRQKAERIISDITHDVESMWETLHPGKTIGNVRLSMPTRSDKAIDVIITFYGLDQESPRLTLSEGFRNSLGLCIFLAMAKRVSYTERPLFLDDVVVSLDRTHRGMILELLEKEFSDRQVIILTHDREWYTELRHQLEHNSMWIFKTLLPYETPDTGIRWSHKTTTFSDARALLKGRPEAAANDARRIMDVELPMIAEQLQIRLPYLRSDKNDRRMAHEFMSRLVADGKRRFQKKAASGYVENSDALDALAKANTLLTSWGNRGSHSFDIVRSEASKLIDACESALALFWCDSCDPLCGVWRLQDRKSESFQCKCGTIRWKYGSA